MATIVSPTLGQHVSQTTGANSVSIHNGKYPLNTNTRWQFSLTGSETGSNAGSNLQLQAIGDDGKTIIGTVTTYNRASASTNAGSFGTITGASPQTLNTQRGIVTTGTLTTAAVTAASYTVNNSLVTSSSLVMLTVQGYSGTLFTNGLPEVFSVVPGSGSFVINFANVHATNALNGTLAFGFNVIN